MAQNKLFEVKNGVLAPILGALSPDKTKTVTITADNDSTLSISSNTTIVGETTTDILTVQDLLKLPSLSQDTIDSLTGSVQQGSLVQNASTGSVNLYDGVSWVALVVAGSWTPETLFAASEPGVWFDPSDLTTLFQDTAGTTPVTTPGQTVALMKDKSGGGNHATQATAASRPTYAVVPKTGRRNLLRYTEQFDNAAWGKNGVSVSASDDWWLLSSGGWIRQYVLPHTGNGNKAFVASIRVKPSGSTSSVSVGLGDNGGSFSPAPTATLNFSTGQVTGGTASLGSDGYWLLTVTDTTLATETANGIWFYVFLSNGPVVVKQPQTEYGSTTTAYQKVTSQYDVTEAGVPSLSYLSFDGVDDWMITPTITPGTDKVQVFTGVRKLSDVASALLVETSANSDFNNGTIFINAPGNSGAHSYRFRSKGTLNSQGDFGAFAPAPDTAVVTGLGGIADDQCILRRNGVQIGQSTADQGTGNYLAYPLYIGRRGGASNPFNGQLFGLITRFGASLDTSTIEKAERWLNLRTGAF